MNKIKYLHAIGMIGLGIMGGMMAEALCAAGYKVVGYDPAAAARARLKKAGGRVLASATAVAASSDVVITSLAKASVLEDVVTKIAAAKRDKKRAPLVVIETSTLTLADKERAQQVLARAGAQTLDCPISGTAVRMKEGAWTIFASGQQAAFKRAKPVLDVFTKNVQFVGAYGNGTKMKFIANHLVAIYNVAVGESMTFARKMKLDPQQVWDLFSSSPVLGNGIFKLRGKLMVEQKYLPATMKVEVWQKDMQVIGDMAKSVDCPLPLFTACAPLYTTAMAQGLSQQDTASVCEVLERMAGLKK
ncbi:MAG TPA: NAD(P)-dependent oxidoreductase [Burkholderiales bacterium]|nr:NAD(P)-dependent oxidoreductase [Burkholderiales bacterium]